MRLRVDESAAGRLRAAVVEAGDVCVRESGGLLLEEMDALCARYAGEYTGVKPSEIPGLKPARDIFRAAGIDPTKRRPSSEALLRRVLQGKGLYRINNAVDACNLCSLSFLLPIGLYDFDAISGEEVLLRMGGPGEGYPGIGKDFVTLDDQLLLADSEGPFGNPSSDSYRTRVTAETKSLLWVVFAPSGMADGALEEFAAQSGDWIVRACGGKITRRGLL